MYGVFRFRPEGNQSVMPSAKRMENFVFRSRQRSGKNGRHLGDTIYNVYFFFLASEK